MSLKAFDQIYHEHVDLVFNLCLNYLQNQHDAEEVSQDVFLKIHSQLDRFENRSSIKTWVYRIAVNQCLDFLKARKRKKRFGFHISISDAADGAPLPVLSGFDHPGVLLEDKEAMERILKLVNTLPTKQKTALVLKSIDGLPQREIAEVMELSEKAVESLLSRARANLKKKLK